MFASRPAARMRLVFACAMVRLRLGIEEARDTGRERETERRGGRASERASKRRNEREQRRKDKALGRMRMVCRAEAGDRKLFRLPSTIYTDKNGRQPEQ